MPDECEKAAWQVESKFPMKCIALGSVVGVLVGRYFGELDRFDVELIVGIFSGT